MGREGDGGPGDAATPAPGPPVHPMASVLLIAIDSLWTFADFAVASWIVTIPLCFATVAIPTYIIQKQINQDTDRKAGRIALLLGGLAAVPYPIFGTPVGLGLLAWTGLHTLFGKTAISMASAKRKR